MACVIGHSCLSRQEQDCSWVEKEQGENKEGRTVGFAIAHNKEEWVGVNSCIKKRVDGRERG